MFLKQYFIVFIFDLHMYSDDMQINWDWLFLSLLYVAVTGRVLCTVPRFLACGIGSEL